MEILYFNKLYFSVNYSQFLCLNQMFDFYNYPADPPFIIIKNNFLKKEYFVNYLVSYFKKNSFYFFRKKIYKTQGKILQSNIFSLKEILPFISFCLF